MSCCPRPDRARQVRDLRALLGHRASLVRSFTACKSRVHAVLADRGIGERSSLWTGPGRAWLAGLALPPTQRAIVDDLGGLLDTLAIPIARLEREIAALAKKRPPFAGTYAQLARRRGNSIATVATARRLLARTFHILKEVQTGCARNNRMRLQHGHVVSGSAARSFSTTPSRLPAGGRLRRPSPQEQLSQVPPRTKTE